MRVTGRSLAKPAPTLAPTSRHFVGAGAATRLVAVTFKPYGETKDIPFAFLNPGGGNLTLDIVIYSFRVLEPAVGPGPEGEEFGTNWLFTWPEGITAANPRSPLVFVRKSGAVSGARFSSPFNLCLPTHTDGAVLKVAYKRDSGAATATGVVLEMEAREEWEGIEAPSRAPSASASSAGVARPKIRVVGSNAGRAAMPPLPKEGGAS